MLASELAAEVSPHQPPQLFLFLDSSVLAYPSIEPVIKDDFKVCR